MIVSVKHGMEVVAKMKFVSGDIDLILNEAYRLTNSIDAAWYTNENIDIPDKCRAGCRSTTIGDIITIDDKEYIVESMGFKERNTLAKISIEKVLYVVEKYGENDYSLWVTETPEDINSGISVRGTKKEIQSEVLVDLSPLFMQVDKEKMEL